MRINKLTILIVSGINCLDSILNKSIRIGLANTKDCYLAYTPNNGVGVVNGFEGNDVAQIRLGNNGQELVYGNTVVNQIIQGMIGMNSSGSGLNFVSDNSGFYYIKDADKCLMANSIGNTASSGINYNLNFDDCSDLCEQKFRIVTVETDNNYRQNREEPPICDVRVVNTPQQISYMPTPEVQQVNVVPIPAQMVQQEIQYVSVPQGQFSEGHSGTPSNLIHEAYVERPEMSIVKTTSVPPVALECEMVELHPPKPVIVNSIPPKPEIVINHPPRPTIVQPPPRNIIVQPPQPPKPIKVQQPPTPVVVQQPPPPVVVQKLPPPPPAPIVVQPPPPVVVQKLPPPPPAPLVVLPPPAPIMVQPPSPPLVRKHIPPPAPPIQKVFISEPPTPVQRIYTPPKPEPFVEIPQKVIPPTVSVSEVPEKTTEEVCYIVEKKEVFKNEPAPIQYVEEPPREVKVITLPPMKVIEKPVPVPVQVVEQPTIQHVSFKPPTVNIECEEIVPSPVVPKQPIQYVYVQEEPPKPAPHVVEEQPTEYVYVQEEPSKPTPTVTEEQPAQYVYFQEEPPKPTPSVVEQQPAQYFYSQEKSHVQQTPPPTTYVSYAPQPVPETPQRVVKEVCTTISEQTEPKYKMNVQTYYQPASEVEDLNKPVTKAFNSELCTAENEITLQKPSLVQENKNQPKLEDCVIQENMKAQKMKENECEDIPFSAPNPDPLNMQAMPFRVDYTN